MKMLTMMKQPSAFLPVAMSFAALAALAPVFLLNL